MPGLLRTSNAALNSKTFESRAAFGDEAMTLQGTVNKTGVLLLCVVASAAWTWGLARSDSPASVYPWMMGGVIGGLVVAIVTIFKKEWSPVTAPLYALLEGLALGGISSLLDRTFPGIAIHAVALTFGTLAVMLVAYKTGVIRATAKFKMGVFAATGGIMLVYVIDMVMRMFGSHVPLINDAGPWGIVVSLVIVGVAALNLILDFDLIETGVNEHAAKYMEWYGGFGLMVTLIWLYLEMLRLLSKINQR
ncbi:MAG TPA: Bax inhibitor-1/YccA family protein [Candidatus Dormibacteraeota bacterium]|nr:Bax inhibitor-1/YccA family protein [Candidatus Dormibacteraeota bacterium]